MTIFHQPWFSWIVKDLRYQTWFLWLHVVVTGPRSMLTSSNINCLGPANIYIHIHPYPQPVFLDLSCPYIPYCFNLTTNPTIKRCSPPKKIHRCFSWVPWSTRSADPNFSRGNKSSVEKPAEHPRDGSRNVSCGMGSIPGTWTRRGPWRTCGCVIRSVPKLLDLLKACINLLARNSDGNMMVT